MQISYICRQESVQEWKTHDPWKQRCSSHTWLACLPAKPTCASCQKGWALYFSLCHECQKPWMSCPLAPDRQKLRHLRGFALPLSNSFQCVSLARHPGPKEQARFRRNKLWRALHGSTCHWKVVLFQQKHETETGSIFCKVGGPAQVWQRCFWSYSWQAWQRRCVWRWCVCVTSPWNHGSVAKGQAPCLQ